MAQSKAAQSGAGDEAGVPLQVLCTSNREPTTHWEESTSDTQTRSGERNKDHKNMDGTMRDEGTVFVYCHCVYYNSVDLFTSHLGFR